MVFVAVVEREAWLRTAPPHANRLDAHVDNERLGHDHDLDEQKQAQDGESEDEE